MNNVPYQSNIPATPPPGTLIAADKVGNINFQRVKIDVGPPGVSVPVSAEHPVPVSGPVTDV